MSKYAFGSKSAETTCHEIARDAYCRQFASTLTGACEHAANGGCTLRVYPGNVPVLVEKSEPVYVASIYPERTQIFDALAPEDIAGYISRNANVIASAPEAAGVGIWRNPDDGRLWLDVVVLVQDRDLAIFLGRRANQICIWDNKAQTTIATGGDGTAPAQQDAILDRWNNYLAQWAARIA